MTKRKPKGELNSYGIYITPRGVYAAMLQLGFCGGVARKAVNGACLGVYKPGESDPLYNCYEELLGQELLGPVYEDVTVTPLFASDTGPEDA
jgi:hypothetical protein